LKFSKKHFRWSGRILNIRLLSSSDGQEEQEMHIKRVFFRKFQLSPITVSSKLKNVSLISNVLPGHLKKTECSSCQSEEDKNLISNVLPGHLKKIKI
jgi:hypothetical protein